MALHAEEVTVTDEPTLITKGGSSADIKTVMVREASATIYIGASTVDSDHGFPLEADEVFTLELASGDDLYAITATTATVRVLINRSEPYVPA